MIKNMSVSSSSNDKQSALPSAWIRVGRRPRQVSLIVVSLACLLAALEAPRALEALEMTKQSSDSDNLKQQQQHNSDKDSPVASARAKLEAELDAIVQQQQHESGEFSDRSLADTIISRLMGENLANELTPPTATESEIDEMLMSAGADSAAGSDSAEQQQQFGSFPSRSYSGPEALKLKKLLSMAQAYEALLNGAGQLGYVGPPMLPASPSATSKRASKLAGNYLQQRQLTGTGTGSAGGASGYGRSSFDFGLGKRPDTAGAASNILRFGDSLSGGGGAGVQGANQFGKRPSAHRYDFGLGKRVASVSYHRKFYLYTPLPPL